MSDAREHPCLRCGACCASYRVAFHWLEAQDDAVLESASQRLDPHRLAMNGTCAEPLRCEALTGVIGVHVACAIYAHRPSPCRDLTASWEDGQVHSQCDRARHRHGLAPLTPQDWLPAAAAQAA